MKRALFWFRRDLRITDNPALTAAAKRADEVIPVYILSSWQGRHEWTGSNRQQFLCGCLKSLAENLKSLGARLIIRQGLAEVELRKLALESGAQAIFFNRDPDPFGRACEKRVRDIAGPLGLEVVDCKDVCLHEADEVLTGGKTPFRVFTPYAKAWIRLPKSTPTGRIRVLNTPKEIASLALPTLGTWGIAGAGNIVAAGEKAARERMKSFLAQGVIGYGAGRDIPGAGATSRLSQDLRFGLLSVRELFSNVNAAAEKLPANLRASAEKFRSELIWREFYFQLLWHFPSILQSEFNSRFRGMIWPGNQAHFSSWCEGTTGFPIVDAAMRELKATGFMANRARMITAMFLTKDLHLDWRLGERYFMQQLTDGEIASNNGGWQWCAGTGADASPYFRIQNPWTQTARYDALGEYIKRWIPDLRDAPARAFHSPPLAGERLAKDYPPPIVNHSEAREKTLSLFANYRGTVA